MFSLGNLFTSYKGIKSLADIGSSCDNNPILYAIMPQICSGVTPRARKVSILSEPSRFDKRSPDLDDISKGTWVNDGACNPNSWYKYNCAGVEESKSLPRTTSVICIAASSATTAN